jgi:hypothetical protein
MHERFVELLSLSGGRRGDFLPYRLATSLELPGDSRPVAGGIIRTHCQPVSLFETWIGCQKLLAACNNLTKSSSFIMEPPDT